jgi:hypothetical protein
MAVSELVDSRCPKCRKEWKSTVDFDRLSISHGYSWVESHLSTERTYWRVLCKLCGETVEILYMA